MPILIGYEAGRWGFVDEVEEVERSRARWLGRGAGRDEPEADEVRPTWPSWQRLRPAWAAPRPPAPAPRARPPGGAAVPCVLQAYSGEAALCLAEVEGCRLPVELPAHVLRAHGLKKGMRFGWYPSD